MKLGGSTNYTETIRCKHGYVLTCEAETCPECFKDAKAFIASLDTSCEPVDAIDRKDTPIYSGVFAYFPDALEEIARISKTCNDQHNPGEEMHWSRDKSNDHLDAAMRHISDHAKGIIFDTDGRRHLGKAGWRILAEIQLGIEHANKASISD